MIVAPDQHLALGDSRIIDTALPPERNGNRVLFRVVHVAFWPHLGNDQCSNDRQIQRNEYK